MNTALEASVQLMASAGIIWAATMAFKRVFREKLSLEAHVLTWSVLIVRLLVPVTLDTDFHFIEFPAVSDQPEQSIASAAAPAEAASAAAWGMSGEYPRPISEDTAAPGASSRR